MLERPVELHLGAPAAMAGGLLAGAVAIAVADRAAGERRYGDARAADLLWLGLAEAVALIPGVSRSGATLAAARSRGFSRTAAHRLSRHAGLPVIAGATLLKAVRLAERGVDRETRQRLAAGGAAAFVSTLGAARLVPWLERDRPLWPYAAYRAGLAVIVLWRLANGTSGRCSTMRL